MVIFIDESGTLPDIEDKYIVIAALVSSEPKQLNNILSKFRRKIPTRGTRRTERSLKELKFHYVGDITRRKVLEEIAGKEIKIYALVIDKIGRKIKDTPGNYGKLIKALVNLFSDEEISKPSVQVKRMYLDKHFGDKNNTDTLQDFLEASLSGGFEIVQVDSVQESRIDLADFIAGAILRKYRAAESRFYDIFKLKIVKEEIKKWNEL